jgi:anti-anti-sigma factor
MRNGMTKKAEIRFDNQILHLVGDLDFNNVMPLYHQCVKIINSSVPVITMDFSGLKSTNSAAIALIVNCMRLAKRHLKEIKFQNIPHDVMSLAKASGLNAVIEPCC